MNICVLDGFTLNPGDLDWTDLQRLGRCQIYDRTPVAEIRSRAADAQIVLTNKAPLSRETLAALPQLKYIGVLATGTNVVDLAAAREREIPVTNIPAYGTRAVAQATFALLLELTNRTGHHAARVRAGGWTNAIDWCFWDAPLIELDGLTLGIVGYGRIGAAVAELARAFSMRVLAHNPSRKHAPTPIAFVALEKLFRDSDVISLHCPLTPHTQKLINHERLGWMKPTAFLLNTGRGALVDETALAAALNSERLAGAGLDVLSIEPPAADNPLLTARNCLVTPHNAWATQAARRRLLKTAVANIQAFLNGQLQNVVN